MRTLGPANLQGNTLKLDSLTIKPDTLTIVGILPLWRILVTLVANLFASPASGGYLLTFKVGGNAFDRFVTGDEMLSGFGSGILTERDPRKGIEEKGNLHHKQDQIQEY